MEILLWLLEVTVRIIDYEFSLLFNAMYCTLVIVCYEYCTTDILHNV